MDINKELAKLRKPTRYGAAMGRRNFCDKDDAEVYLQRVQFVDGDYDRGGAYWGGGRGVDPLYCAMDDDGEVFIFVRAKDRQEAKRLIRDDYPNLKFKR